VTLHARPSGPGSLPGGWLAEAVAWVRDLARRLAPEVAYAFVAFEPSFRDLVARPHQAEADQAGQDPVATARLAGAHVADAYWYQVLSPGHLRGLGELPAGAQPLPGDGWS
jgi:hypothetical protein